MQGGEGLGAAPIWLSLSHLLLGEREHRLVPWADPVYHVRNRAMMPRHGRWLQRDPNASGVVVHGALAYHGGRIGAGADGFDLSSLHRDGFSLQQYVGSNGWRNGDPLGLYNLDDGYDPEEALEDVNDILSLLSPVPTPVDFIRGMASALVGDYSANLDFDVDWAMDWSLSDDDHSRTDNTWVALSLGRGLYDAFEIGLPFSDATVKPLDAFASAVGGKKSGQASRGAKAVKRGSLNSGIQVAALRGQKIHMQYRDACGKLGLRTPPWRFEETIAGVGRVDAMDFDRCIVRELKPNTPTGRAKGIRQLLRYIGELELKTGKHWTGYLDSYDY